MNVRTISWWCAAVVIGSSAFAQETPPASDATALQGPKVAAEKPPESLVQRDVAGKLVRLEERPEQAALKLLDLSPMEREGADAVLKAHAAAAAKLLSEHTDLFLKVQTARQGGASFEELAPLMREFEELVPELLRKPLVDRVSEALPEAKRARFHALVQEYGQAIVKEEAGAKGRVVPSGPFAARRLESNLLLRDMGQALRARVTDQRERLAALVKAVEATPEQAEKIDALFRSQAQGPESRTAETRMRLMRQLAELLTPEQRVKLRAFYRDER
jgi:hypothetical protein